jgi:cytochrome c oxidase subunit IV
MSHDPEHVEEHVRTCIIIFLSLMVLTAMTVWASYLDVPTTAAIAIALCIAGVKATLVILYFMHLVSEKKLIYYTLALTVCFFLGLIFLPLLGAQDIIRIVITKEY